MRIACTYLDAVEYNASVQGLVINDAFGDSIWHTSACTGADRDRYARLDHDVRTALGGSTKNRGRRRKRWATSWCVSNCRKCALSRFRPIVALALAVSALTGFMAKRDAQGTIVVSSDGEVGPITVVLDIYVAIQVSGLQPNETFSIAVSVGGDCGTGLMGPGQYTPDGSGNWNQGSVWSNIPTTWWIQVTGPLGVSSCSFLAHSSFDVSVSSGSQRREDDGRRVADPSSTHRSSYGGFVFAG